MDCTLTVLFHTSVNGKRTTNDTQFELTKRFDLPFAPYTGLQLIFPPFDTGHPNATSLIDLIATAPELATGVFQIEKVNYSFHFASFSLFTNEWYQDEDTIRSVVEQLLLVYDFALPESHVQQFEG